MTTFEFDHVDVGGETIECLPDEGREVSVTATVYAIMVEDGEPVQSCAVATTRVVKRVGPDDCLSKAFLQVYLRAKLDGRALFEVTVGPAKHVKPASAKGTGWLSGEDLIGSFYAK